jgi:Fe-S cluster assembly protein SufB
VEIFALPGSRVRYTTVQNWSDNIYNLVTKRARAEADAVVEWIDCNIGSKTTMKYPCVVLAGERARGEVLSIAMAGKGQHQDTGAKMIHLAPETSSKVISKSISKNGGRSSYRGLISFSPKATNAKAFTSCDALILDSESRSDTYPDIRNHSDSASVEHEATVEKIGEETIHYLKSRGIEESEARGLIVNGFIEPVAKEIPLEYAVELNRLIHLEMEGSVG